MATILLVDDEPMIQGLVAMILKPAGHTILSASNGLEGISLFRSSPDRFDLVVTDLQMPIMDGHEFVKLLRSTQPGVRILCMSGYTSQDLPPDVEFLQKPFSPAKLREYVEALLCTNP